jgi:hypothetical protein
LFPGVRLNISKSGPSASFGAPGATFNIGPRGTRSTFGIPGTGVSYVKYGTIGKSRDHPLDADHPREMVAQADHAPVEASPVRNQFGKQLLSSIFRALTRGR